MICIYIVQLWEKSTFFPLHFGIWGSWEQVDKIPVRMRYKKQAPSITYISTITWDNWFTVCTTSIGAMTPLFSLFGMHR